MNKNKHAGWNTHCISHVVWKRWESLTASSPALCSIQLDVAVSYKKTEVFYLLLSYLLSPKYPSRVRSGSRFSPVSTPALPSGTGWAEPLCSTPCAVLTSQPGNKGDDSIPGAAPAPGALPRQLWGAQTGMVLLHICGTLEVFVVGCLVFPQFGVYCIFFMAQ